MLSEESLEALGTNPECYKYGSKIVIFSGTSDHELEMGNEI